MVVYDYECFKHDVLLGVLDINTGEIHQVWGVPEIKTLIEDYLSDIWVRI